MKINNTLVVGAILLILVMNISLVSSSVYHEETLAQAEEIIKQKISCDELTNNQLEILGDYYMEQMHPEELHEIMDERMGGGGSESLRQAHINMGKAFYCGEHGAMSGGMMNIMMGRGGTIGGFGNMMSSSYYGNSSTGFGIFGGIIIILTVAILILLIILLIKKIQKPDGRK